MESENENSETDIMNRASLMSYGDDELAAAIINAFETVSDDALDNTMSSVSDNAEGENEDPSTTRRQWLCNLDNATGEEGAIEEPIRRLAESF